MDITNSRSRRTYTDSAAHLNIKGESQFFMIPPYLRSRVEPPMRLPNHSQSPTASFMQKQVKKTVTPVTKSHI